MNDSAEFYDALETRDPQQREEALLQALPKQVAHAQRSTTAWARRLAGIDPRELTSRAALARLPVTRKHDLAEEQKAHRASDPFGGFAAIGWRAMRASGALRVFQSPGGLYEPEGGMPDYWRIARAVYAAGFRRGDLAHNSFSYHLTPAGSMMETGAHAVGCTVFPGGVGNTELQLQAMLDLRPDGYLGTPSFLKILLDKADAMGRALPHLRKALVSGEAFPPSLRQAFAARGIDGYQCYATADVGLIAYETAAREGLVLDEQVIVEIVRPGTGDPVPDGEVGEVVVTTLNPDYPLVRFGTGDLSAVLPGRCPTGRTNTRIRGWMGRADQTTKVRGMFVHPSQVADVLARHPELRRARLVVSGAVAQDRMTLHAEVEGAPEGLALRVAETVREITKLRCEVQLVSPGTLPNDGKVIEDARRYD
ncbi:phenylacetate--CoA ligase family protein [Caldimonas thermodepolymerans]|uniref:Phenylacetate-CoA ligase n=1 Tax=Caldimonas thermodepolymerans TaxID=215580 RepID=A0AA46HUT1_9BURK|nr:AMP-binding protein [Caldimonas thermodepolymerans]TCP04811.1 phenylacetate-CoA ligase [Caldimonas thermodepolymerans]UZG47531.1 AMP-binding protein [Caldimonas thermodepolymerans]